MKALIHISRIIVGLLFIFSGLVKANDPLGLSYKMQEFFELWGMSRFDSWTLLSSMLMNAFEIIAGFALLLGWRIKLFSWLLLLLIIFFTFLTGYTYVTGKPTNCGCFGDCLPISSQVSFFKDLILTLLIGLIFWKQSIIRPVFPGRLNMLLMLLVTIFSFGLQWYALTYLPPVDCLPFKKGNNIPAKMLSPPGAVPDSFAIRFVYEKAGKEFEFAPAELPADLETYTYKSRTDKLIRKGNAEPAIKGFKLTGLSEADSTSDVLSQPHALLLFCEDFSTIPFSKWKDELAKIYAEAFEKNIPVYAVVKNKEEAIYHFEQSSLTGIQLFTADIVAIHTAARTNPCLFLLKQGTIVDKQGYKRMNLIGKQIKKIPKQTTSNQ